MYRFLIILAVLHSAVAATEPTIEELIDQIFGIEAENAEAVDDVPGCSTVEGRGAGCYECHFCNNSLVHNTRYQSKRIEVILKDGQCAATKICCVTQRDLVNTFRSHDACGKSNPGGMPRRRRTAVRAVLQGEYPWRAWVYNKNSQTPLCAATFIHEDSKALITLASCVGAQPAETLEVAFAKGGARAAVSRVTVHESYKTGEDQNNIAIVQLRSLEATPTWASPACLPCAAPPLAAPCIVVTETDLRIDSVIPIRKACSPDNGTLPDWLTCALAPPGDYQPETAAGLYCQEQQVHRPTYTVHGLFTAESNDIASYVNVWHYTSWLNGKLNISK